MTTSFTRRRAERTAPKPDVFVRLATTMVRHRRCVFAGWLIAVVAGLVGLPHLLGSLTSPPIHVTGSESVMASEVLGRDLPIIGPEPMLLILHADELRPTDPAFRSARAATIAALSREPGVTGVLPLPVSGELSSSPDVSELVGPLAPLLDAAHSAILLVGTSGDSQQRQDRSPAQRATADLAARRASGDAVHADLVGVPAWGQAAQQIEMSDLARIELVAVPLALLVLVLGLRAPVVATLPVAVAAAAVIVTLGVFALFTHVFSVNGMLLCGVSAIGLGVGIDYALFVVGRYREELARGVLPQHAVGVAMATSGRTVVYSGLIVFLTASSLLLMRWLIFAQFAVGIAAVIVVALAASVTLLPTAMVSLTRWLEWKPRWMSHRKADAPGATTGTGRLARWTRHLMRHPTPYIAGVTGILVLLAAPAADLKLGFDLERHALADTSFGTGLSLVEQEMPGATGTIAVLLRRPATMSEPDTGPLLTLVRDDPMVAAATKLDNGINLTTLWVIPREPADSPRVIDLVHRIRSEYVHTAVPAGTTALVGGTGALMADIVAEVSLKQWWVIGTVLVLMFLLLAVLLRSLLLPLKAVVMNLLATAAALGLTVLLFQHGAGEELFGFASPGTLWPQIPVLVFTLLLALSMDYEMFLVRRIQEEYRASGDNTASVAAGLQRTARPISLAALILAVTFGAMLVSPLTGLKAFGFTVAVGLVIDATLIRLVLVPTLMRVMGRWNWWLPSLTPRSHRR